MKILNEFIKLSKEIEEILCKIFNEIYNQYLNCKNNYPIICNLMKKDFEDKLEDLKIHVNEVTRINDVISCVKAMKVKLNNFKSPQLKKIKSVLKKVYKDLANEIFRRLVKLNSLITKILDIWKTFS